MIAEIFVEKLWNLSKSKSIHLAKRSSLPCQWRPEKKKLDKITKSSQCLQTCTLELLTNLNSFVTKITKDPFELPPENSNFRTTKQFHGFYL